MRIPPALTGPPRPLPLWADRLAERWIRLPWRLRAILIVAMIVLALAWHFMSVANASLAQGTLKPAWIAVSTLTPGQEPKGRFKKVLVPSSCYPPLAVTEEPSTPPALTLVEGAIATSAHFDGLARAPTTTPGFRPLAITTPDADLYAPGSRVDLFDTTADPPVLALTGLYVISVKDDRILIGIPEAASAQIVTLVHTGAIQLVPAASTMSQPTLAPASPSPRPVAVPEARPTPGLAPTLSPTTTPGPGISPHPSPSAQSTPSTKPLP